MLLNSADWKGAKECRFQRCRQEISKCSDFISCKKLALIQLRMWPSKSRSQIFRITLRISEILMFIVVFAVAIVQARRSHAERLEVRPTRCKIGLASIHKKGSRAPISADCFCPDRKTRGQAGTNIPTAYICKDCHHQGTRVALLSWLLSTDFKKVLG